MGWFAKKHSQPGWLALGLHPDRVDLVHITRGAHRKPAIVLCDSYRREGSFAETLLRLRKEVRLDQYRCTTLLKNEDYQMHQVDAPNVPAAELKTAVRWRVKDLIDYPIETATVDVLDVPLDGNVQARNHQVYAVTARNSAVEACAGLFNDAGVPLEAIDIPDLAQRNIAALFEPAERGIAMLAFYEKEGMLTFTRAGELYLVRRIDVTLAQLSDPDAERRNQYFERVGLELQRSLDHFDRQYSYVPLSKLLLAPLPPDNGLPQYLAPNISLPVESVDLG
ncbi:MAG TPA: agglutinin biogenesis protein MshI, partial [Burkholderiales bacterium]|nr:agglutinin biogenesis protein MshI [Burkholderiales bacterium]